jgi:hypothetical protein
VLLLTMPVSVSGRAVYGGLYQWMVCGMQREGQGRGDV